MNVVANSGNKPGVVDPESTVTPSQLELLALYASGYSYEEIGRAKFMSYQGVRKSLWRACDRSGARNPTHLCVALLDHGMIRVNAEGMYEPIQDLRIAGE